MSDQDLFKQLIACNYCMQSPAHFLPQFSSILQDKITYVIDKVIQCTWNILLSYFREWYG